MNKKTYPFSNHLTKSNPPVQVKLFCQIKITSPRNWRPVFYASCIFEAADGEKFEPYDRLNGQFAIAATDFLLKHHKANGFALDTPAERVRLSRLIKSELERQAVPIQKRLKRYGYPVRFKSY